jgi:putative nucleotidyltransferase with HDIG domain
VSVENRFIDIIITDIANNRLEFPTLPEVALRVRKLVEDPKANTAQISKVLSTDPALTSSILKVANSAVFTGLPQVENIKSAVNRLGLALVRNMVTCVVMKALYQPKLSATVRRYMANQWKHSTRVAAYSHALAKPFSHLRNDQAMLAGLIHDIGALPIITRAEKYPDILNNPNKLQSVINKLHCNIGKIILEAWNFPQELVTVAAEHEDLNRLGEVEVEYVDIVAVANLHSHLGSDHPLAKKDWASLPVFSKLDLTPVESIQVLKDGQNEIAAIYQLLGATSAAANNK